MMEIVINIIECLMLSCFLVTLMDVRKNKKLLLFISLFVTSTTIITLSNYLSVYDIFLTSIVILFNIIVSCFFVNNDLSEIVFYACLETLISAASNVLVALLFSERIILIIGSKSLYLLFAIVVVRILKKKRIVFDFKVNMILSLIMFALQIFISHFMQLYVFFMNDYSELKYTFLFLFITFIGIMYMIIYMFDLSQVKQEYERLKDLQDNSIIITNLYREVKIAKHDVIHVYNLIHFYLKNEEYTKL